MTIKNNPNLGSGHLILAGGGGRGQENLGEVRIVLGPRRGYFFRP